jgi:hypothetical protein
MKKKILSHKRKKVEQAAHLLSSLCEIFLSVVACDFGLIEKKEEFVKSHSFEFPKATWLILPVVICLSQRLSHAGLSMS